MASMTAEGTGIVSGVDTQQDPHNAGIANDRRRRGEGSPVLQPATPPVEPKVQRGLEAVTRFTEQVQVVAIVGTAYRSRYSVLNLPSAFTLLELSDAP